MYKRQLKNSGRNGTARGEEEQKEQEGEEQKQVGMEEQLGAEQQEELVE